MELQHLLQEAKEGFSSIPLEDSQKEQALNNLTQWLSEEVFAPYRPQLLYLFEQKQWSLLLDSFYRVIPFGTGGRRGAVGIGPNRMNPYTLSTSVQGHCLYLRQIYGKEKALRVVIAYDVRQFLDLRKVYSPDRPNPLMGMTSRDLCHLAASIYAANGIEAYILSPDDPTYLATPELSFLIRAYHAQGGLNVSASHNHPDDNGGKFYNEQGAQPIAPDDQEMSDLVETVRDIQKVSFEQGVQSNLIRWIDPAIRRGYVTHNASLCTWKHEAKATVAYSPMNGVGSTSVTPVLEGAGYTVKMLPAQIPPDGSFAAVRFRVPNPEVRTSLVELIAFAKEQGADLALASDPDADRIGCVAPDAQGEWRFFNGNEIGVLVAYQLLSMRKAEGSLPAQPIVIKTEVTTGLLERLTKSFGGKIVSHLLVGCKFIADVMHNLEHKGRFLDLQGSLDDVIMGTEESHGVLITPTIRDKDAAGAALILADLTSRMKAEGRTLVDAIEDIYQQHGYFSNTQVSMVMEGAIGLTRIRDMQAALRNDPPQSIGGIPVIAFFDHWREDGIFGAIRSETDRSARNVLVFHLEGGVRVILRPSGTEPKAKLYIEVASAPTADRDALYKEMAATDARAAEIGGVFAQALLQRIGIDLPRYAFAISDIVPIDLKHRFAQETLPALRAEAERLLGSEGSTAKLLAFAQERFSALNKNAPSLFLDGALAYLRDEKETLPPDLHALLRDAFAAFPR